MPGRIYLVEERIPTLTDAVDGAPAVAKPTVRLVRATHPGHALRTVAQARFAVRVATQDDLLQAVKRGVEVEEQAREVPAGPEPTPSTTPAASSTSVPAVKP